MSTGNSSTAVLSNVPLPPASPRWYFWALPFLSPSTECQLHSFLQIISPGSSSTHAALELGKAAPVLAETGIHPPFLIPEMVLPHFCPFQEDDVASAVAGVTKLLPKVTNQKYLTPSQWSRETCPTRQELVRLRQASSYPSLDTLMSLLFSTLALTNLLTFIIRSPSGTGQTPFSKHSCLLHVSTSDVSIPQFKLGCPADLLTKQTVLDPSVHCHVTSRPAYTISPGILFCVSLWAES